ncbi:SDR family oxidoreductase [Williamsia phyllosphaerae]|uniref:Oxidoreductase n=1 Tax=Williamsia phyllosphaerae TaxID=885042 RepID=A0ABQ1UCW7_9NOCA|nr:SDR family NAD(P)-dependent oxidoreductase [Williamsia phyllosphaerae]GGF13948.1 oxidoreductase [Williamsia phyllosphaerae]
MKTTGNTMFIPGGTSGIGLGLALRFHAAGNTVIVAGRRREKLEEIASEHPGIHTVELDVSDPGSITAVAADVQARFGDLDVLIAMAGVMKTEDVHTGDFVDTAAEVVTTNLLGSIRLIGAFTEFFAAKSEATIMTVSSGLAFTPMAATPTYSATKAAVHAFTDAIRIQLADTGIQVIELAPPAVQTDLMPGQAEADWAMPLDDFLTEVVSIIDADPTVREILVENVKPLRHSETNGNRDAMMAQLAGQVH